MVKPWSCSIDTVFHWSAWTGQWHERVCLPLQVPAGRASSASSLPTGYPQPFPRALQPSWLPSSQPHTDLRQPRKTTYLHHLIHVCWKDAWWLLFSAGRGEKQIVLSSNSAKLHHVLQQTKNKKHFPVAAFEVVTGQYGYDLLSFTWPQSQERVCVCLKPADWPVMFRSEQHVLTLALDSLSFHYTTAHPGLSDCMCVCVFVEVSLSVTCAHTHTEWQMCFVVERGEQCLQDAADREQTSVAELGIRLGTSARRVSLNLLNPSAGLGKTGAHFRFTRFHPGS